ncbi:MAG: AAA family ATPase, partial [Burkholderiales bacterium]
LVAEAGIGKSRIVRALRDRIAADAHEALNYQCSPYHDNSAFFPIITQFERAAQFASEDTPAQKLAKMEALLAKAQMNIAEVAPLYAAMLSLPTEGYPDLHLSPQQQKERTIAAKAGYVMDLAKQRPVLMVLEDVHWADPSSLEVFGALLERIEFARVLLLITYRPEFTPTWRGQARVTTLSLARLSRKETAGLAERVSGKPLPPEVLEQILAKTDGVPLFVEELTKAVLESGLMKDAGDRYTVSGPLPPLAIPSTLHDSLMARLDRMGSAKELIQWGAVIGREFGHKLIGEVSSLPAEKLGEVLNQLVISELVLRRGNSPDAVYVFKHALVQDAAYESILKSRRQKLHADVAAALERDAQIAQSDPGFLAQHFDRAGLSGKAIEWYLRAALQAKSRFANVEALRYLECALALLAAMRPEDRDVTQCIDAHTEIGMLLAMLEGYHSQRALEYFAEAEKLSRNTDDMNRRFRVLTGIITSFTWRRLDSNRFREELTAIAAQTGDRIHRIYAHATSGESHMFAGRYKSALAEFERVHSLYDERVDAPLAFQSGWDPGMGSLINSAYMRWETGHFDGALSASERFVFLSHQIGHPYSQAFAYGWTSDLAYYMWLPDRARHYADLGVEFCRKHGFSLMHALCSFHRGWVHAKEGHYDEAIEQMTQALVQYREVGSAAIFVSRMIAQLASVYGLANRCEEGLRVLESSPDRVPGNKRVRFPEISRIEGELHLNKHDSDPKLAERFFREAMEIAIEDENKAKQLRAAISLAKLWQSQGKTAEAKALLQPLYDSFTEGFDFPDMKNAKAVLESM